MLILFLVALLVVASLLFMTGTALGLAYGPTILLMMLAGPLTAALAWAFNIGGARCDDYEGQ